MAAKRAAKKPAKKATKAPAKKAAAKAPAKGARGKKPAKQSKSKVLKDSLAGMSKRQRIEAVMSATNVKFNRTVLRFANDDNCSYLLRRPFGITSLDIALAGGVPASATTVLFGPDGVGKDYLFWKLLAEQQRLFGEDFGCAIYLTEFKQDKLFMKDFCGFHIGFTDEELKELDKARKQIGLGYMSSLEIDHYTKQIGNPVIFGGLSAEEGFDILLDYVATNACQVVGVNSIGNLQTEAKEKTESLKDFAQMASEAALFSKLMPQLANLLNAGGPEGERNTTTPIFLNQARTKTDVRKMPGRTLQEKEKYKPAMESWSLKHLKAVELALHKGAKIRDSENRLLGRTVHWETAKGKLGLHEGLSGSIDFFYDAGMDTYKDLILTAVSLGVIQKAGAWLHYEDDTFGFRAQGDAQAREVLCESEELFDHLRDACFSAAGVLYRHT